MSDKTESKRDAFTFSLRGSRLVSSYHPVPAIADDRINKARDERLRQAQDDQPDTEKEFANISGRFWLWRRLRRAA